MRNYVLLLIELFFFRRLNDNILDRPLSDNLQISSPLWFKRLKAHLPMHVKSKAWKSYMQVLHFWNSCVRKVFELINFNFFGYLDEMK